MSVQSRRSMRSNIKLAPTTLTQEQFDIVNLNGQPQTKQEEEKKQQYKLEE